MVLGIALVLDLNFTTRARRDAVRAMAARLGAAVRLYRLQCSDKTVWTRIERRNVAPGESLSIARETFRALKAKSQPLDADEARIEVAG